MPIFYKHLLLFFLVFKVSIGMTQKRVCESDEYLLEEIKSDPMRQKILDEIELKIQGFNHSSHSERSDEVIIIPVVVHIVYKNDAENLSEARIKSQIDALNQDFRRLNVDKNTNWSQAADTKIEFVLAKRSPNGQATNGIERVRTTQANFNSSSDYVKYSAFGGANAWSSDSYLNIWVCDIAGSTLGYAQFPGGSSPKDGVVIDYQSFGTTSDVLAPFNLGRTATHEIGHWLGLKHIWGASDCSTDDLVDDTPKANRPHYNCEYGAYSCGSKDMIENYMDYSDDVCMNLFTLGQKNRMRAMFDIDGPRHALLTSQGHLAPTETSSSTCENIIMELKFDNYPGETSFSISEKNGNVVFSSPKFSSSDKGKTVSYTQCLVPGCYQFSVFDSYKDGICCKYGQGNFKLIQKGSTLFEGGEFGANTSFDFCVEGVVTQPTCEDGIKNGDETGVDCGGAFCNVCPTCTDGIKNGDEEGIDCGGSCTPCHTESDPEPPATSIPGAYFETGWDGWTGGTDTKRYTGNFAFEGDYCLQIQDNSGAESTIISPIYNFSSFQSVELSFSFYANSMESGEKFLVQYFDGDSWHSVQTYTSGQNFQNGTFYSVSLILNNNQYTLSNQAKFAFECDASTNADQVYIDAVEITGNPSNSGNRMSTLAYYIGPKPELEVTLYPNPASDHCVIQCSEEMESIKILSTEGQLLFMEKEIHGDHFDVQTSNMNAGIYIVQIESEGEIVAKKLFVE
ncbi:MAG: T9SS type A sorting domain-containing protein [Lewinellaceae bacterium]|nr:T9SS type A sorting domain-containing protein [Lewinellaceae bacterium]